MASDSGYTGDEYRVLRNDLPEDGSELFEEAPSLAELEELTKPLALPKEALRSPFPGSSETDKLAQKAIFLLGIYPRLNPTMLHIGLGPHVPPRDWKPVLDKLIEEGVVKREILNLLSPLGQYRSYTVISLANPPGLQQPEAEAEAESESGAI